MIRDLSRAFSSTKNTTTPAPHHKNCTHTHTRTHTHTLYSSLSHAFSQSLSLTNSVCHIDLPSHTRYISLSRIHTLSISLTHTHTIYLSIYLSHSDLHSLSPYLKYTYILYLSCLIVGEMFYRCRSSTTCQQIFIVFLISRSSRLANESRLK